MENLDKARLRWQCRRGMRELDMLLGRFLDECFDELTPKQQLHFAELLGQIDANLYSWLVGLQSPEEPHLKAIVDVIKQYTCGPC
jgi:antitoxin CptB